METCFCSGFSSGHEAIQIVIIFCTEYKEFFFLPNGCELNFSS